MQEQTSSAQFSDPEPAKKQQVPKPSPIQSKINQNFMQRTRSTIFMLLGFVLIMAAGQFYCMLLVMVFNFLVFKEITSLKRDSEKEADIPMTKYINWMIFAAVNYFCLGVILIEKFPAMLAVEINDNHNDLLNFLVLHHSFISFCALIFSFVAFVLSLKQGYLKYQFRLFALIVVAASMICIQSWLMVCNIIEGMFWFVVPSLLVICNDIFAYLFGYFFGTHKLIALSPKKTWEGFIGGGVATILFSLGLTSMFISIPGFVCPMRQIELTPFLFHECSNPVLQPISLSIAGNLPGWLNAILEQFTYAHFHTLILALFASTIGPFGGFFASGLKRAIKIKDFGDTIPGHGGLSDRMDCQLIMGSFTYFYLRSFVFHAGYSGVNPLLMWLDRLSVEKQLFLLNQLQSRYGNCINTQK